MLFFLLVVSLAHLALASQPTHLVVLQHGLYGSTSNMVVLRDKIQAKDGNVLAHLASSNEGLTRDGVAAGGRRLAAEIRQGGKAREHSPQ